LRSTVVFISWFDEGPHIVDGGVRLACPQEDLLGDAAHVQSHRHHVHLGRVFLDEPTRQGGHTAAAGHHLQHDDAQRTALALRKLAQALFIAVVRR